MVGEGNGNGNGNGNGGDREAPLEEIIDILYYQILVQ